MAGDSEATNDGEAASSAPPQPCCSSSSVAGGVGVEEGQTLKGSLTSTKRKANTGEDAGCATKRKATEKPCDDDDSMAVDDGCDDAGAAADDDDDDWVPTPVDEDGRLIIPKELREHPAGVDENGDYIMDDELLEHLEYVKTLNIIDLTKVPGVTIWSGVHGDDDESEEEGEEVVQKPNTKPPNDR